jgi:hypothetical protein
MTTLVALCLKDLILVTLNHIELNLIDLMHLLKKEML